ncbi:putative anion transporter [Dorcoceras hygrometricum]|uniref:Putative anion transporter n=1 Tax=Dorcoceras hygrometricum TaxID=472368 RepID=A0A2Z6ZWX5_9LAMI|nr:putative anion transporter [Dorcoceras hygrometricum]
MSKKKMNSRSLESVAQELASEMMTSAYLLEKATSSNDDASYLAGTCAWLQPVFQEPGASRLIAVVTSIRSTTRFETPSSDCTRSPDEISTIGFSSSSWPETNFRRQRGGGGGGGGGGVEEEEREGGAAML